MTMKHVVVWGVSLIVLAACGDVVVSAPTTPDCQAACRAGETCVAGVCVEGVADAGVPAGSDAGVTPEADAGPPADAGITIPSGDGQSAETAAVSCQQLLVDYPDTESDVFWIDPDGAQGPVEPMQLFCGMEYDNAWTQVAAELRRPGLGCLVQQRGQPGRSWELGRCAELVSDDEDGRFEILIGLAGTNEAATTRPVTRGSELCVAAGRRRRRGDRRRL